MTICRSTRGWCCLFPARSCWRWRIASRDDERAGEFFGALLMMNAGAMIVAAANEMVFLFVGLELVSIPTYLILYLSRRDSTTQEAATKYFFLSIFASGLVSLRADVSVRNDRA